MSHLVQIKLGVINDDTGVAAHWIELAEVRTNQRTHTHTDMSFELGYFPPPRYQFR